jgi:DNA polymerase III sliding clamp (beta) subunit (PCNA family)
LPSSSDATPILANVLIRKTGSQIQLTTSDLEIQIRTNAELDGDSGSFTTTVGARKLIDIRSMPSDQTVSVRAEQIDLEGWQRAVSPCKRCQLKTFRWCRKPPALALLSRCRKGEGPAQPGVVCHGGA